MADFHLPIDFRLYENVDVYLFPDSLVFKLGILSYHSQLKTTITFFILVLLFNGIENPNPSLQALRFLKEDRR
jgi:hypothetical protein